MGLKWECPADSHCSTWALSYFSDCLCSSKDMISFYLGMASIVCWGVTEVPQILSSLRTPNTESVSLAFVFTWMLGDIFNLAGCLISPGTLPTQVYLAILYTATTLLLVGQQVWYAWLSHSDSSEQPDSEPLLKKGRPRRGSRWRNDRDGLSPRERMLVNAAGSRSLPVLNNKKGRPALPVTSSLPGLPFPESPPSWRNVRGSSSFGGSGSGSSPIRGLVFSSLVIVGVTMSGLSPLDIGGFMQQGAVSPAGGVRRQLLQGATRKEIARSLGLVLGWLMMCIYLTGRLPQIILNWSHDFVLGVSTSTIIFAFLCNVTYLGSILVRGVGWQHLKPVLPWIADVTCCILMDILMISRYLIKFYREGYTTLE